MNNEKDDNYYIDKIKYNLDRITNCMNNISYDEFCDDVDKQEIAMFNLIQISENAKKLSEKYIKENSDIPWHDVYGLRNRIVHDYGNVVLDIVYQTLVEDIPELRKQIIKK